jgi:23S rRNA pseudouridine1911/1915/1917 synthase
VTTFVIAAADDGHRLDHVLAARLGLSHARARALCVDGAVRVDGKHAKKGALVHSGMTVTVDGPIPTDDGLRPIPDPEAGAVLRVVFEDAAMVVIDKLAGLPSHPLRPGERGTVANALVARFPECGTAGGDPREAGLCNRLDLGTSGLLVAARTASARELLRRAFRTGRCHKIYLAVAVPQPGADTGFHSRTVDLPLAHDPSDRRRMVTTPADPWGLSEEDARPASTELRVTGRAEPYLALEARTSTGRMHQVRVHAAAVGLPLYNDPLYGAPPAEPDFPLPGPALHAGHLTLPHPDGRTIELHAPPPPALARLLARAGYQAGVSS